MIGAITAAAIAAIAAVFGAIIGMVSTLAAVPLQHRFEVERLREQREAAREDEKEQRAATRELERERRAAAREDEAERRVAERRDQYVSGFFEVAYTNLRYLIREGAAEGFKKRQEFAILARKASLYLDDELDAALDKYTADYVRALLNLKDPETAALADNIADFGPRLHKLHKRFKVAVQGKAAAQ